MNLNRANSLNVYANTETSRKRPATDRSEIISPPHKKQKMESSTIHIYSASSTGENPVRNITVVPPNAVEVRCAAHPGLQEMPDELLLNIFSHLNLRDSFVIKSTFEAADRVVNDLLSKGSKRWFSHFSPLQQAKFNKIAEGIDEQGLRTWLGQFTADEAVVIHLLANRHHRHFPEFLFYTVSQLMADCQAFKVEHVISIEHVGEFSQTNFSDDGNYMLTLMSFGGQCKIHALSADGHWKQQTTSCHKAIFSANFSGHGKHVLIRGFGGYYKIHTLNPDGNWIVENNLPVDTSIDFIEFSPDSLRVAIIYSISTSGSTLRIFGRGTGGAWAEEGGFSDGRYSKPSFSRDGNELFVTSHHKLYIYHHGSNGSWEPKHPLNNKPVNLIRQVSPNDSYIITTDDFAKNARIFGRGSNNEWMEQAVIDLNQWVISAGFSPNSRYVVANSREGTHAIYHLATDGSWIKKVVIEATNSYIPANFSFDSRYLAITTNDDTVKLYGLGAEGQCTEMTRIDWATHVLFSPDGNHIVTYHTGNPYGKVRIYGLSQYGKLKHKGTIYHGQRISSATFSPTGRYLVTNEFYNVQVKLWSLCSCAENGPRAWYTVFFHFKACYPDYPETA